MPKFDPEGDSYDYESAKKHGIKADKTGHWQSREPKTGLLLKGRKHKTWHKTIAGEKKAGYVVYKKNGRYYSRKAMSEKAKKLREDQLKRHTKSASDRLSKAVSESKKARDDANKYKKGRAVKKEKRLPRVLTGKKKKEEKKNWAQKLKGKVQKHFKEKKASKEKKRIATRDRKRKESRRGKQRREMKRADPSLTEKDIDKVLPWNEK